MNKNQNHFNNIGEQIKEAFEDAINSMDFQKLNETVSSSVNGALEEVRRHISSVTDPTQKTVKPTEKVQKPEQPVKKPEQPVAEAFVNSRPKSALRIKKKLVGKVSGVLYLVFGGIGTGLTLCALFALLIMFLATSAGWIGGWLVFLCALLGLFVWMIGNGGVKRERLSRFRRYLQICGNKTYCEIGQLAAHTGKSVKYVQRDLRKMIKLQMLPEGHLDEQGKCLMLDDATYKQYLETKKFHLTQQELKAAEVQPKQQAVSALDAIISEGQDYIRRLQELNKVIAGQVISDKLYRLEHILKEIFEMLREHPEQQPQMRKFMDYYLPTTLKLVQAYEEFDSVQIQGDNITSAKEEIEKTLDTINKAFEKLLDDLFQDTAFDVTTDAQVLQTMLAQEGLAEDETFKDIMNQN